MFFAEQERKWANLTIQLKEKNEYYRDLCKTMFDCKDEKDNNLIRLNDILFSNNLTEKNLQDHKLLIKNLIHLINTKRNEVYLSRSNIDTMQKELLLFVHGFDLLKLDKNIREKIREIDWKNLYNNICKELSHKQ